MVWAGEANGLAHRGRLLEDELDARSGSCAHGLLGVVVEVVLCQTARKVQAKCPVSRLMSLGVKWRKSARSQAGTDRKCAGKVHGRGHGWEWCRKGAGYDD